MPGGQIVQGLTWKLCCVYGPGRHRSRIGSFTHSLGFFTVSLKRRTKECHQPAAEGYPQVRTHSARSGGEVGVSSVLGGEGLLSWILLSGVSC